MVISRLAPSPTGSLHVGNVRTFLWAWLSARAQRGRVILRVEDIDTPRLRPGVIEKMLDDLNWLGLTWDEGPRGPPLEGPYIQSRRREYYRETLETLRRADAVFPCVCTRGDLEAAQSAPHEGDIEPRYPGTCRGRFSSEAEAQAAAGGRPPSWRLKTAPGSVQFTDVLYGPQRFDVHASAGDFVVARAPDNPAYQLAVVADDISMGVTEVVRGDDLLPSTARQALLYGHLGAPLPVYGHVPLVVGPDGKRLAKRHGDARIAALRERGVRPERIIGVLARWSGLDCPGDAAPAELVDAWSWQRVPRERLVMTPERLSELEA